MTARNRPITTLPPAGPGRVVTVRVLLGAPNCGGIQLEGNMEEVGRMLLGDGTKVLVVAWSDAMTPELEDQLARVRTHALAQGSERPVPRATGWGTEDATGVPFILDAGDPRPPGTWPSEIPRYDGPPDVYVAELPPAPSAGPAT